jgi:hypothetical protein
MVPKCVHSHQVSIHFCCLLGQCHHDKSQQWTRGMLTELTVAQVFLPFSVWLDTSAGSALTLSCSQGLGLPGHCALIACGWQALPSLAYQEGTEHVETDEVEDGKAAATGSLSFRAVVLLGLWGTLLAWHASQHDVLPGLTCGTPGGERQETLTPR